MFEVFSSEVQMLQTLNCLVIIQRFLMKIFEQGGPKRELGQFGHFGSRDKLYCKACSASWLVTPGNALNSQIIFTN